MRLSRWRFLVRGLMVVVVAATIAAKHVDASQRPCITLEPVPDQPR